ncbi:MAG: M28 family metallopeptidase [Thermodesulfobacteriota bacterium]|jgi:polyhydroxyalkanoate synthesis regulator phasin
MELEKKIIRELSGDTTRTHIEKISREIPFRMAGTQELKRMAEYLRDQMSSYGIPAEIQEFDALVGFTGTAELRLLEPEKRVIQCRPFVHIANTAPGGIEGELVFVGSGASDEYKGKDVRGKVTLSELSYSPPRQEKQRIAADFNSSAQIMINWGPSDSKTLAYGSIKPPWGNPTPLTLADMPRIPSITISRADGEYLIDLCRKGRVVVWLRAESPEEWRSSQNAVGWVEGSDEPEKFVIIGGHMDSWGGGVTCNATGNFAVLEVIRAVSLHRREFKRSIRVGFWSCHETGTMVGSSTFVDQNWDDLSRNCMAYINVDSPGMRGTNRYSATSSTEIARFHQALEREILGEESRRKRLTHVGDQSFMGIGIPSLSGRTEYDPKLIESWHGANLAPWHHSDEMTLDKMDIEVMLKSMKVYVAYLVRFCNTAVLPYDHLAVAKELKDRLEDIASSVGGKLNLSRARRYADELLKNAQVLHGHLEALRKETERMSSWKGNRKVLLANRVQMKLSRILHPVNFSVANRYGFDHYGLTALSTPIPCLYETRNLGNLFPSSTEYRALLTHLVQQANRVSDGLCEASEVIENTLEDWRNT